MLVLRKVKQLLSNFEAETRKKISNLRLAQKISCLKESSVLKSDPIPVCAQRKKPDGGNRRPG